MKLDSLQCEAKPQAVTAEQMIDLLNDVLKIDPEALQTLLAKRVPCNKELADHPTVQIRDEGDNKYSMSLLGLLNGVFGVIGEGEKAQWGWITMECEFDEETQEVGKINTFYLTEVK